MRGRFSCVAAATAILLTSPLMIAPVAHAQAVTQFDLAAQPLADALRALGAQANINVLFDPPIVAHRQSPAVKAQLTVDEALGRLLEGTGIKHQFLNERTVVLEAPAKTGALDAEDDSAATDAGELEIIVVTARRTNENLQDVPISVTVYSAEALEQRHIVSRNDLADNTPSLIAISGGYPKEFAFFALRGQGPAFGATPGVVNYFAEVPNVITVDGRTGTYFDLANVQVLAGPQGTLFGKNTTGGNILFEPQRPTQRAEGYVKTEYGNYDHMRVEGALNVPIVGDSVLFRVAGEIGRRDGYTKDVGPAFAGKDYDNLRYESVRASLLLRPTDSIENYTVARYYHSDNNGPGTVIDGFNPNAGQGGLRVVDFFPGMATAPGAQDARGVRDVAYNIDQFSKTDYWQVINHTTLGLGASLQLKNIVSYSEFCQAYAYDYDGTIDPLAGQSTPGRVYAATGSSKVQRCTQDQNVFSEELQLQGQMLDGGLQFTLGGYTDEASVDDGKHEIAEFDYFPLTTLLGQRLVAYVDQRPRSKALFTQVIYDLGHASSSLDGLSLTAGYRYTWDKTRTDTFVVAPPVVSGGGEFDYGSYTFTLDYAATPALHLYGTVRSAYKAGGINGPVPEASEFRSFPPEKLSDFEVGLKSQFSVAGVAGRANLAAYRGNYDNIQRTTQDVVDLTPGDGVENGVLLNVTRSAAKGKVQGIEFTGTLLPVDNLTLDASYSFIDAKYTKFASTSSEAILTGAPFPFTPKQKYTVAARYEIPLGVDIGTLGISANYAYQGEFSTARTNFDTVRNLPGYGLLNMRAELSEIGGRPLDLAVFVANVADKEYRIGLFDAYTQPFGFITYTYGEPRMYGLQLSYRFGE